MRERDHKELMLEAITAEGEGHGAALAGDRDTARDAYARAAAAYRASWVAAPPGAYGRLVGLIKAATLAGDASEAAAYVTGEIGDDDAAASATAAYALAVAALIGGDDERAATRAAAMRAGGAAFDRAGAALLALARADRPAYEQALEAIVADFAARTDHLTGVRIADTAVMLERLAQPRGLSAGLASPLVPA